MTTQETATALQTALDDVGPLVSALARGVAAPDSLMGYQRGAYRPGLTDAENALAFAVQQVGAAALAALPAKPPEPPVPFAYQVV